MKLEVNQNTFVSDLLSPVSKLSDNLSLDLTESNGRAFVSTADNSLILSVNIPCKTDGSFKCIIPECKTFLRLFSGISKDSITINVESNYISYKDEQLSFKYHLLDESYIINKKTISEQKLDSIEFDTKFILTKSKLSEIIKFNSIIPDAEKLYFFTETGKLFAKIGDEQKSHVNEIVTEVASSFQGKEISEKYPISIQNILLFSFSTDEIVVSVNHQLKVFKFESAHLKYFVMGLVK